MVGICPVMIDVCLIVDKITLKNSGGSVARRRSAAAKDADSATVLRINNFSTDSIMWRQRWKK